jgi:hypothetical protein
MCVCECVVCSDESDDDFQAKDEDEVDEEFNTPDESVEGSENAGGGDAKVRA